MSIRLLRDLPSTELNEKRVLWRVDFDVPIKNKEILDDFRIRAALPTLRFLQEQKSRVLILTKRGHLKIEKSDDNSTRFFIPYLENLLEKKVGFLESLENISQFASGSQRIFLFENLRFWPEEENNDENFAGKLAAAGDLYVSDNFGTAHREHASVAILPKLLPSYAGFLLEKEIFSLNKILKSEDQETVIVLGGAKPETKLPLAQKFLDKGTKVLLGGGLANLVLCKKGVKILDSYLDKPGLAYAEKIDLNNPNLILPVDAVVGQSGKSNLRISNLADIVGEEIFDIGPETLKLFKSLLNPAKMIFWNGPLGVIEQEGAQQGTIGLAKYISGLKSFRVIGGGDSIAFLRPTGFLEKFDLVSTGGGAMLEFLSGRDLPGINALTK